MGRAGNHCVIAVLYKESAKEPKIYSMNRGDDSVIEILSNNEYIQEYDPIIKS